MSTANGRSCGSWLVHPLGADFEVLQLSLRCKPSATPEISKPSINWCEHCRPGKGGCNIYAKRTKACRDYGCLWLDGLLGAEWQPTRAKIVVQSDVDESSGRRLLFLVDPSAADRWRSPPYYEQTLTWSEVGLRAEPAKRFVTYVVTGGQTFLVLPSTETTRLAYGERGTLNIKEFWWTLGSDGARARGRTEASAPFRSEISRTHEKPQRDGFTQFEGNKPTLGDDETTDGVTDNSRQPEPANQACSTDEV